MEEAQRVAEKALKFHKELQRDSHGRYRSWEHCYKVFYDARLERKNGETPDYDYLSLHLAFYLASWGMYRGSSFLLQQDYTVHEDAVKEILHEEYDILQGIECKELRKEEALKLLLHLKEVLRSKYNGIRDRVMSLYNKDKPKTDISDVLVSKILMGTLGCTPAYDRFFVDGIKGFGVNGIKGFNHLTGVFNRNAVEKLIDFYEINFKSFEVARLKMSIDGLPYPQMKLLDMGFWQIGKEKDDSYRRLRMCKTERKRK